MISDIMSHFEHLYDVFSGSLRHSRCHDIENSPVLMFIQGSGYIYHILTRPVIDSKQNIVVHLFRNLFLSGHIVDGGCIVCIRIVGKLRSTQ